MYLLRRRFGARNETRTDKADNPPPSYEDSQDASMREVLQGARDVLPLLWPSSSSTITSASYSSNSEKNVAIGIGPETDKSRRNDEIIKTTMSPQEDAIIEVLSHLAMAPCGGHPFLDRIRQFSDFYFTPYMANKGSGSPHEHNSSYSTEEGIQAAAVPQQEQQRMVLENINAPRESAALLLCARVLEEYYAGLGHIDSIIDTDIAQNPFPLCPECPKEKNSGNRDTEKEKGGGKGPVLTTEIRMKTKLTQIAACVAEGCVCCDFDEAISNPSREAQPKDSRLSRSPLCGCGHPRTSHSSSPSSGISRLLRHYTNWNSASYTALGHRSPAGQEKRRVVDIRVCSAPGTNCRCPDYDKGRHTGRCGRCGHYDDAHSPANVAREEQKPEKRQKRKGKRTDLAQKNAEWELSWILVENAYLLLNQMAQFSPDENQ
ncbi:hypothetical protein F5X98DRAFT_106308 [Xylaria grammica]|nr:hypothetical protein F5X98DRAFT_106308 [Xylaria grammica]